ncbi:MAG: hypothetical protein M3Q46_03855 [Verrucomicrobiota bacterium]|nr:hypothetical protein [Verrucomicrobiota bacterium]
MKTTTHIHRPNHQTNSDPRAARFGRSFPAVDQAYQGASLLGSCGTPARFNREAPFFELSNRYFAQEAPRGFALDAAVFGALILSALLPIVNGAQAVATLIHTAGVL